MKHAAVFLGGNDCFCLSIPMTEVKAATFSDVPDHHPYVEMIEDFQKEGWISGYPDGTFQPNGAISRAHVAHLLVKVLGLPAVDSHKISYVDVPRTHPYFDDIARVTEAGIFSGDGSGYFRPEASLTRVQMAKVLDVALDLDFDSYLFFPDVPQHHWGFAHVQALARNNITTGDQGFFKPNGFVTRAHYVVFLHRAVKQQERPGKDPLAPLSHEDVFDLINRLSRSIESTLIQHKHQGNPFSKVLEDLQLYATPSFAAKLEERYETMCLNCDWMTFLYPSVELHYRFELKEHTPTVAAVDTVSFSNMMTDGFYVNYRFEKVQHLWKLADYGTEILGAGSFEISREEALEIVRAHYEKYVSPQTTVTFVDQSSKLVWDWYTKDSFLRLVYRFQVHAGSDVEIVYFQSHDGLFYTES